MTTSTQATARSPKSCVPTTSITSLSTPEFRPSAKSPTVVEWRLSRRLANHHPTALDGPSALGQGGPHESDDGAAQEVLPAEVVVPQDDSAVTQFEGAADPERDPQRAQAQDVGAIGQHDVAVGGDVMHFGGE